MGRGRRNSTDNIYTRLGVKPLINGRGTWTYLSASLELSEVRAAQVEAAQHFVKFSICSWRQAGAWPNSRVQNPA